MVYRVIPIEMPLRDYEPPTLKVECLRCKRNAPDLQVQALAKRFGSNIVIGELARRVALSGRTPCGLAETGQCGARALEPPVFSAPWMWHLGLSKCFLVYGVTFRKVVASPARLAI